MNESYLPACERLNPRCVKSLLLSKIDKLQRALWFWLPSIPPEDPEIGERTATDTLLLIGLEGAVSHDTAESLGWIHLRPVIRPWLRELAEATAEVQRLKRLTNAELLCECAQLDLSIHPEVGEMMRRLNRQEEL